MMIPSLVIIFQCLFSFHYLRQGYELSPEDMRDPPCLLKLFVIVQHHVIVSLT